MLCNILCRRSVRFHTYASLIGITGFKWSMLSHTSDAESCVCAILPRLQIALNQIELQNKTTVTKSGRCPFDQARAPHVGPGLAFMLWYYETCALCCKPKLEGGNRQSKDTKQMKWVSKIASHHAAHGGPCADNGSTIKQMPVQGRADDSFMYHPHLLRACLQIMHADTCCSKCYV